MSGTDVAVYRMNPQADRIVYGDELSEGMWVLTEDWTMRQPRGSDEDSQIRAQCFRQVTRFRRVPPAGSTPAGVLFIGEWVDGYQEIHRYADSFGWLVRKDPEPDAAADGGAS